METDKKWSRIYELAAELYSLSPWETYFESDIFGVESPITGKQYFISIMGSNGVLPALAAYEGAQALRRFWSLENSETEDASNILIIPHLILTFENENDVEPGQLKRVRSLARKDDWDDRYPELRHVIPGRFPVEPDTGMLDEMIIILEQTLEVMDLTIQDPDLLVPDGPEAEVYLMRKLDRNSNTWLDTNLIMEYPKVQYDRKWSAEDLKELNTLPLTHAVMQAHGQLLPAAVKEKGIDYFTYLVILVNKKSGVVENFETMIADPDFHSLEEKVPAKILNFIKSLGFRPRAVEVKSDTLYELLAEPLRQCNIKLNKYRELPALSEAIGSLMDYVNRQRE